ncbi:MAG: hypothetical protein QXL77_01275 [Candidatus Bathyarchaeia archaeon]
MNRVELELAQRNREIRKELEKLMLEKQALTYIYNAVTDYLPGFKRQEILKKISAIIKTKFDLKTLNTAYERKSGYMVITSLESDVLEIIKTIIIEKSQ